MYDNNDGFIIEIIKKIIKKRIHISTNFLQVSHIGQPPLDDRIHPI